MHRTRLRFAVIASLLALVVGSGTAAAGPFTTGPLVQVSAASPIAACDGDAGFTGIPPGVSYTGAEVEPHVVVNPSNSNVLIGAWQQDRWNNGGSEGLVTATSTNGGTSWAINANTRSSKCTGGTPANGGFYDGVLTCLTTVCIPLYPASAPTFLDTQMTSLASKSGYNRTFQAGARSIRQAS